MIRHKGGTPCCGLGLVDTRSIILFVESLSIPDARIIVLKPTILHSTCNRTKRSIAIISFKFWLNTIVQAGEVSASRTVVK